MEFYREPIDKKSWKTHGSAAVVNAFIINVDFYREPIDKKSWKTHGSAAVVNAFYSAPGR